MDKITNLYNFFRKDSVVGLDIGSSSIKMAQFIKKTDGLHLVRTSLEEIRQDAGELSWEKDAEHILKKLVSGINHRKTKFIVVINCPKTVIRTVTVPYMPLKELKGAIVLSAKSYFPFPVDEALLDFEVTGDVMDKGVKKQQLLLATCPIHTVDKYITLLDKVGIKPDSFITASLALQKVVEISPFKEEEVRAFLDIGKNFTEFTIFKGKNVIFYRKIPIVGDSFTKALTGALVSDVGRTELSMMEAENIKKEVGIPLKIEVRMLDNKISTNQVLAMLRAPAEQLVSEIERCFDYYREETGGGKIDSLVLLGAGAYLKGLGSFISEELGVSVQYGLSLSGIKAEHGTIRDDTLVRMISAIGAGLTEAQGANLLPVEIKEGAKRSVKRAGLKVAASSSVIVLILVYMGMSIQISNFQKRISVAQLQLNSLNSQLEEVKMQNMADKILESEPFWEDVFKELGNLIQGGVYITEFGMDNRRLKLKGVIATNEAETALSNFIIIMEKGLFNDVKLVTTKDVENKNANEFELDCWVD